MGEPKLDYNKHLKCVFGEHVQAHLNRTCQNDTIERTLDAIHLHPSLNTGGGHHVMNLNTGKVIVRPRISPIPMTNAVRDRVEELAHNNGITEIKFF